jgi:hypothetical protein
MCVFAVLTKGGENMQGEKICGNCENFPKCAYIMAEPWDPVGDCINYKPIEEMKLNSTILD